MFFWCCGALGLQGFIGLGFRAVLKGFESFLGLRFLRAPTLCTAPGLSFSLGSQRCSGRHFTVFVLGQHSAIPDRRDRTAAYPRSMETCPKHRPSGVGPWDVPSHRGRRASESGRSHEPEPRHSRAAARNTWKTLEASQLCRDCPSRTERASLSAALIFSRNMFTETAKVSEPGRVRRAIAVFEDQDIL